MRNEVPDSWIERHPIMDEPDHTEGDRCMVCGLVDDCICPDDEEVVGYY